MKQAVIDEIDAAVKAARAPGAPLVASINRVFTILRSHKLMLEQQIEPGFIGIHAMNRDGHGIAWRDAERLLQAILDVGFDAGSVMHPTCSERVPGDNDSHLFNEKLSQESGGRVPFIPDQHLKFLSLSCSHLNTTLRMIAAGAKCSEELSCCENGTISMHQVEKKDPAYASFAKKGLRWNVISQHVMQQWPELAQLIQAALNTGSAVAKEEHEMQILLRIAAKLNAGPCQWDHVKQELQRSKPRCMAAMPMMFSFCRIYGAGLLSRTSMIVKAAATAAPRRQLGPDFFELLSQEPRPRDANPWVNFRHALLATAYTCPDKVLTTADVRKLGSKQSQKLLEEANQMMVDMDKLVESKIPAGQRATIAPLLGLFESQLVFLALEKKAKELSLMESMGHAALALCKEVHEAIGVTLSKKWDHLDSTTASGQPSTTKRLTKVREYDDTGKLKDPFVLLHESGFVPGTWITRKQNKLVAKLLRLENDQVVIECEGDEYSAQVSSFLENKWKVTDEPKAKEVADHLKHSGHQSEEMATQVTRGKIIEKLMDLDKQHKASLSKVKVFKKPRSVEAAAHVPQGKLVLVPATNSVQSSQNPKKGLQMGMCDAAMHWTLNPPSGKGIVVPFWYVKTTADNEKANMEVVGEIESGRANRGFKVPLMKNHKDLEEGDILMKYEEGKQETPEELVPVPPAPAQSAGPAEQPAKKRKTGKSQDT